MTKKFTTRMCLRCGKEFKPAEKSTVFCSRKCYRRPLTDRFWEKVVKTDSCWLWTGSVGSHGRGQIELNGVNLATHRVSWELHNGPVPDGLFVLHSCPGGENPRCCNPAHLRLGTHTDNMADMVARGRSGFGEKNSAARLTDAAVIKIRVRRAAGDTEKELAAAYCISKGTVGRITRRETWRHL
jgi:hypothetical protein